MRPILPFKILVKKASWITDYERWAFYHMESDEQIAVSRIDLMQELTRSQKNVLVNIVMSEWTKI